MLKEILIGVSSSIATLLLTNISERRSYRKNFKIQLYFIYYELSEWVDCFYKSIIYEEQYKVYVNDNLVYKDILDKYNYLLGIGDKNLELSLKEIKSILSVEYMIKTKLNNKKEKDNKVEFNIFTLFDINENRYNDLRLNLSSALNKIKKFIGDDSLDEIKFYSIDEIFNMRRSYYKDKAIEIEEIIKDIESKLDITGDSIECIKEIKNIHKLATKAELEAEKMCENQIYTEEALIYYYKLLYEYKSK